MLENEEYLERYHEYLQELVDEYVEGGRFDEVYSHIRSQIDELVEMEPNALYDYDEYTEAAEMLYETVNLRAESISGQLNGTIPSTDARHERFRFRSGIRQLKAGDAISLQPVPAADAGAAGRNASDQTKKMTGKIRICSL